MNWIEFFQLTKSDQWSLTNDHLTTILVFQILRQVISKLAGNREYVIKICAATKSLSETEYVYGPPSGESRIFLPEENCQMRTTSFQGMPAELSAGMIVGAVCSCFFLLAAVIGYIIWR